MCVCVILCVEIKHVGGKKLFTFIGHMMTNTRIVIKEEKSIIEYFLVLFVRNRIVDSFIPMQRNAMRCDATECLAVALQKRATMIIDQDMPAV